MKYPKNKSQTTIDIFDANAQAYQDKYMDVGMYHKGLDVFCGLLESPTAHLLDIACGPGNVSKYISQRLPQATMLGIDLAPKMLALAKVNNPQASFEQMDAREIAQLDKKFQGILCAFCLPYLSQSEALKLIADVSNLLTTKGVFYLSTMEDDYAKSAYKSGSSGKGPQMYMYYHEATYLLPALKKNGFEIIDVHRLDIPGQEEPVPKDLVIVAQKLK